MDFQVKFSEQAAQDVSDIIEYICDVLYNPGAAERFYNEVNKKRERISENPFIYPLSKDEKLCGQRTRTAVIGNFLMFYSVDETNNAAYIIRIIYGKRDIAGIFPDDCV